MSHPAFEADDWCRALSLSERAELMRAGLTPGPPGAEQAKRAGQRLRAWKNQGPFDRGEWLARRLSLERLDEEGFARLLSVAPEVLRSCLPRPPAWLEELREAYAAPELPSLDDLPLPESVHKEPTAGFLQILSPLMHRARKRLHARIQRIAERHQELPFDPAHAERLLFASLPQALLWMLDRTLVLELNVARVQGRLPGATPEERFRSFVESLRRPDVALALLQEYPVLARLSVERITAWLETSCEFVERLCDDWPVVRSTFFAGEDPGALSEMRGGAGDSHRGGRSVMVLGFANGGKIVYKPRSLSMDGHFQDLLRWVNSREEFPPFRILQALDRGMHGWVEFVSAAACVSDENVRLYHRRLGGLLALLYAIGAVDFHFENLIAAQDQPVPIDLESLFHPQVPRPDAERPDERLAVRVLVESVLRVGLLPFRVGEGENFAGADLSGVAAVDGKPSPDRMLQWERSGSDEMRAVKKRLPMEGGRNRPVFDGKEVDVADHIGQVEDGFRELYALLVHRRDELLSEKGPLGWFASDPARAVLRSTRGYGLLLDDSFHPDFLGDALDRDRFFDRLWVGVEEYPALQRFVAAEHRALLAGDVPCFGARPGSTDLWTDAGERIAGFFPEPALVAVRRRLQRMGEDDLDRQAWLSRISLGTLLLNREKGDWPGFSLSDPGSPAGGAELRTALVSSARRLGDWFDRMAVRDEEHVTWVGLDLRNQIWSLFPISEDLYAGTPGIALFLAYLGTLTGEARYRELAHCGMRTLLARLGHVAGEVRNIGMFQGWGGVLYTLTHLGALWKDPALFEAADAMVEQIAARVEGDTDLDVVSGSAGAIAGLMALHHTRRSPRALEVARRCGERLLATARATGGGAAWFTRIGGDEPQSGFSHGAGGIGLALLELAAVTSDDRFRGAALSAFAFERDFLWSEIARWIEGGGSRIGSAAASDKPSAAERSLGMSWCYGAPGVGLSRLRALRHLDDPAMREEAERAVAVTLQHGFGKNHSLCHGDLGNLDLILQARQAWGRADLAESFLRLARAILASVERDGWICGTVACIEAPGLMNGLAGIGYGLLRIADPDRVPSVLVMEPPAS
ncbi:MAG: type 2 lantipeptide synthetase LanM [Acidobacteria bacterium]|nr:MAG: type 2 lantipeptide synthetase LanM [Acidobacteriota bacterium]